jgi:hypothetical protein
MRTKSLLVVALSAAIAWSAAAETPVAMRRFAFVAGSNDGGETLVKLRYAESDARSFATVLQDLGGVRQQDMVLVTSPSVQRFHDALQRVRQMIGSPREMDERRELVFYYSGHADDDGFLLGRDRVTWEDLRADLSAIPADIKVAIVDACSSGSLTRAKGGVTRPAFLFDASSDMTGHAYLTSASAEEAAQESDRIGSSFFTHFLISGLRGAADAAGDGVVTLEEAYAYAYKETLASTEKTQYGPQHPAREMDIAGSGNIVLTDLRSSAAGVTVSDDIAGRLYFRDSQGDLAVELNKVYGDKVELGLEPDTYSVVLDNTKGARFSAEIKVTTRQRAVLGLTQLKPVTVTTTTARGQEAEAAGETAQASGAAASPSGAAASPSGATASPSGTAARPTGSPAGDVIGAAVGAAVGSALGRAVGTAVGSAVSAAITAASAVQSATAAGPAATADPRPPEPEALPAARDAPRASVFHFSFLPDFRGGLFESQEEHNVSINLLAGSSGSSRGFEVGGLANLESGDVVGFQAAGLANIALGSLTGFQAAGLVNYMGGEARFFQTAGLVNVSSGLAGAQIAGWGNVSLDAVRGAQVAGLFNWADTTVAGVQVAGVANWGREVKGPQISVVNIADTITGAQVGVVNIARHVTGTQVGVLNFADKIDGIPIGVISLELQGRHDVALWIDLDGTAYANLTLGTKHLYTVLSAGWMPSQTAAPWSFGFGIGGRSDVGPLYLDYDLSMVTSMQSFETAEFTTLGYQYPRIRLVAGLPLFGGLSLEAGVSLRVLLPYLSTYIAGADPSKTVFQPGFVVGVNL